MVDYCGQGSISGPSGTYLLVEGQVTRAQDFAQQGFDLAMEAIENLAEFKVNSTNTSISYGSTVSSYTPFAKPTKPSDPELEFTDQGTVPTVPTTKTINDVTPGQAPVFTAQEPTITLPPRPGPVTASQPGDPPPPTPVTLPTQPDEVLPPAPTLRDVTLPERAVIDLDPIRAAFAQARANLPAKPSFTLSSNYVSDLEAAYTGGTAKLSTWLGQYQSLQLLDPRLKELLSGSSTGLPAAVEAALRERAFEAVDEEEGKAIQAVSDEFSARGFSLPSGLQAARTQELRQRALAAKANLSRDIFVQAATWEIENLRFAVGQGVVWQGQLLQSWVQVYESSRAIAFNLFEIAERVVLVRAREYELALQRFRDDIASIQDWIKVELAELEIIRAELEKARIKGTLNEQDVNLYLARLQGVRQLWENYKTKIEGINLIVEQDRLRIQGYESKVKAFGELVQANAEEWRGYGEAARAELGKATIFEVLAKAFAERVRAYGIDSENARENEKLKIEANRDILAKFNTQLERLRIQLQAEVERVRAGTLIYDGKARMYSAELGAEQARAVADTRKFELDMEENKATAQMKAESLRLLVTQVQEAAKTQAVVLEAIARTAAQLFGAAQSSVNLGAHLSNSDNSNRSTSCSTNYQIDATP